MRLINCEIELDLTWWQIVQYPNYQEHLMWVELI